MPRLFYVLKDYPKSSTSKQNDKLLRVNHDGKYYAPLFFDDIKKNENEIEKSRREHISRLLAKCNDIGDYQILVIYDRNSYLREFFSKSDNDKENLEKLLKKAKDSVVIAIRDKLDKIWLNSLGDAISKVDRSLRFRCIVIITADALREHGLDIASYSSAEKAVRQVVECLNKHPMELILGKICAHLVVIFHETAALYINMQPFEGKPRGTLHICPNHDRTAQTETSTYGEMPGKFTIILTAIVKELYHAQQGNKRNWNIDGALRLGVMAYNYYFNEGFCGDNESPHKVLERSLSYDRRNDLIGCKLRNFRLSSLDFRIEEEELEYQAVNDSGDPWSRTDVLFKNKNEKENETLLCNIVIDGLEKAIRNAKTKTKENDDKKYPEAKIVCPYSEFGKIKTFDKQDIEQFYDISNLIRKYLNSLDETNPLSIAAFGRPGSGKSFTVKEIIDSVSPGRKSEPLIYNLAQFDSVDQLTEAFHHVQDRVISSKEVPLVIFDEFDSEFKKTPLGWLKYFLAPMQDGRFQGKTGDYRIGRAIFLFSGGTSETFGVFNTDADTDKNKEVKLKDFISRLSGHLDISGINQSDNKDKNPLLVKLNRAIILRSLLEKHAKKIFRKEMEHAEIQKEIVSTLLNLKEYRYGVRSMEAIILMSRWINNEFEVASLPSDSQLEGHVDVELFRETRLFWYDWYNNKTH